MNHLNDKSIDRKRRMIQPKLKWFVFIDCSRKYLAQWLTVPSNVSVSSLPFPRADPASASPEIEQLPELRNSAGALCKLTSPSMLLSYQLSLCLSLTACLQVIHNLCFQLLCTDEKADVSHALQQHSWHPQQQHHQLHGSASADGKGALMG